MSVIHVGLNSWIVQDGNYDDFETNGSYRFALEFSPKDVKPLPRDDHAEQPIFTQVAGDEHEVFGTVLRVTESNWVADFGVPAFQDSKPPAWAHPGVTFHGRVYIGVDPYFYGSYLKDEPGMPNLFREWIVTRILLETTPWVEVTNPNGSKTRTRNFVRDSVPRTFVEVSKTDAWHDDGGCGNYILECKLEDITFGGIVKVRSSPETDAIGISGKIGQIYGETTPSLTGVDVIGGINEDYALHVSIEGNDETYWLSPDLLEFVHYVEGTDMCGWEDSSINPPKKWWQFWK